MDLFTNLAFGFEHALTMSNLMYCAIGSMQFGAQVLMIASMKYIPVSVAALIACCTPLVVMPVSMLMLKNAERLRPLSVAGVLATVAGVALVILYGGVH
jgi:drug/metabolite transporter (DMT)-like permease